MLFAIITHSFILQIANLDLPTPKCLAVALAKLTGKNRKMRAYQVKDYNKKAQLCSIPTPEPAAGQVRVKIETCGLNFADLLMMKGQYQEKPVLPFIPGMELAGTVDALGPNVTSPSIGTQVAVFSGQGGLAEYGCFEVDRCVPLPDDMPFSDAAAFQIAYGTSHMALDHKAGLRRGETLLVLGAAGGVGLTAVQIGKQMGARVIACARGKDKLAVAKEAGADHLIDSNTQDIREAVKALGGADVVYDPIGGEQFTAALRACNPEARILVIGFASGTVPQIPANLLLVKNISVVGLYWGGYLKFSPETLTGSMARLFEWYTEGTLKPHISHSFPFDQLDDAFETLRQRKSTGKVIVTL